MLVCRGRQQYPPSACLHRERRPAPWQDQRSLAKPSSRPGPGRRRWWWWTAWLGGCGRGVGGSGGQSAITSEG